MTLTKKEELTYYLLNIKELKKQKQKELKNFENKQKELTNKINEMIDKHDKLKEELKKEKIKKI